MAGKKKAKTRRGAKKAKRASERPAVQSPRAARRDATGRGGRNGLGRGLLALYEELGELSRAARSAEQKRELRDQQEAIGAQLDRMIGRTIRADTEAYREATVSLKEAAERTAAAMEDVNRVVEAIVAAARVIDAVSRVLAAAGSA